MGEIDTKPIEPVQASLSLFGQNGDQIKSRSTASNEEKKGEMESLLKELANYKLKLELKESAHKQAVLEIEKYQKTVEELSCMLKNTESEKDKHRNKCMQAETQIVDHDLMTSLELELANAKEEITHLKSEIDMLSTGLEIVKKEMGLVREREKEADIRTALAKAELHKARSKIAAAEAAEERGKNVKSGLYQAVQQLALEAEEAKKENQKLKQETKETHITISIEEYESLIMMGKKADEVSDPAENTKVAIGYELEILKRELEMAKVKIGEYRSRAEQAVTRAEMAEKAKAALEDQLRRWREQKQRRRAASDALKEASVPTESNNNNDDNFKPTPNQPLGKVLNLKF